MFDDNRNESMTTGLHKGLVSSRDNSENDPML